MYTMLTEMKAKALGVGPLSQDDAGRRICAHTASHLCRRPRQPLFNLFLLLISDQRVCRPCSRILSFLVIPLGVPRTSGSQTDRCLVGPPFGSRFSGMTCTLFQRQSTMVSKKVRSSSTPATTADACTAPSLRSTLPPTPVAAAANANWKL
jgi:hypothetical protein